LSKPPDHQIAKKKRAQKRGRWAEYVVRLKLRATGHRILRANYKTKVGEIDIIYKKQNRIGFVEVKARKTVDAASEAVTPRQRIRIERAAQQFMAQSIQLESCDMQFDVACVTGPLSIHMLYDAWRP